MKFTAIACLSFVAATSATTINFSFDCGDYGGGSFTIVNGVSESYNFDLKNLGDIGLDDSTSLSYHLHTIWTNSGSFSTDSCGADITGQHYDPNAACGPASEAVTTGMCDNAPDYTCSTSTPGGCELGDLSGKYGNLEVDASGNAVKTDSGSINPALSSAFVSGNTDRVEDAWTSMVFHDGGPRVLCCQIQQESGGGGRGGCFSGETAVQVRGRGAMSMRDLTLGDLVLTNMGTYKPVYAWAHLDHSALTTYLQIQTTAGGSPLEITGDHMLLVEGKAGSVRADLVELGDVLVGDKANSQPLKVSKIKTVQRHGAYAPLTPDGTIVVDGIVASSYVSVQGKTSEYVEVEGMKLPITQDAVAHAFVSPLRLACMGVSSRVCDWQNAEGVHVLLGAGQQLVQLMDAQSFPVQLLGLVLALAALVPFVLVEVAFGASYGPAFVLIGAMIAYLWVNGSLSLVGRVVNKKNIAC